MVDIFFTLMPAWVTGGSRLNNWRAMVIFAFCAVAGRF
jgi:hypothetical protein